MQARHATHPLDSFRKILQLEQQRRFDDKAVTTGLDEFLARWKPQLLAHIPKSPDATNLLSRTYSRMTPNRRAKWVDACLALLESAASREPPLPSPPLPRSDDPCGRPPYSQSVTPTKKPSPPKPPPPPDPEALNKPVTHLKGVDKKTAAKLERLHVHTVRDLLYHFPRYHKPYDRRVKIAHIKVGDDSTVVANVREARQTRLGAKRQAATRAVVGDDTGNLNVVWFNNTYLARQLRGDRKVSISGKVDTFGGSLVMIARRMPSRVGASKGRFKVRHSYNVTPRE